MMTELKDTLPTRRAMLSVIPTSRSVWSTCLSKTCVHTIDDIIAALFAEGLVTEIEIIIKYNK